MPDLEIPRDRWGRPLIAPLSGGPPIPYTRATTVAGTLDDQYHLGKWAQRSTALGLVERPDLLLAASAHREDKKILDEVCEAALKAGKGDSAATIGTALHSLTERIDRGLPIGPVPYGFKPDLDAYEKATAHLKVLMTEQFVVVDRLKIAGTLDRIVEISGTRYVADIKTGSNVAYGALKIAIQMALYTRGIPYDPDTGRGEPHWADLHKGLLIELPQGTGTCKLHWVDLDAGYQAVGVASQVREWRRRSGLISPAELGKTA